MRATKNPKIPEGINASEDNPLHEFALLLAGVSGILIVVVVVLSLLVEVLVSFMPFRWEQKVTGYYEQNLVSDDLVSVVSEVEHAFNLAEFSIAELGEKLANQAGLPDEMTVSFHLMEEAAPNAFATIGGHIFVTTGLLQEVSSENALAMVLAHEIGHIVHRHPIQALSRGVLLQLLLSLITGNQDSAVLQSVLGQTGLLTILRFNRDMEHEADVKAVSVLTKRYGYLKGANEFFQSMSENSEAEWQVVFQTHPGVESRIDFINASAGEIEFSDMNVVGLDERIGQYLMLQEML